MVDVGFGDIDIDPASWWDNIKSAGGKVGDAVSGMGSTIAGLPGKMAASMDPPARKPVIGDYDASFKSAGFGPGTSRWDLYKDLQRNLLNNPDVHEPSGWQKLASGGLSAAAAGFYRAAGMSPENAAASSIGQTTDYWKAQQEAARRNNEEAWKTGLTTLAPMASQSIQQAEAQRRLEQSANITAANYGLAPIYGGTPGAAGAPGATPGSAAASPALEMGRKIHAMLREQGWTDAQASAYAAGFAHESGGDPAAVRPEADGRLSAGIGQWNGPRLQRLFRYANAQGVHNGQGAPIGTTDIKDPRAVQDAIAKIPLEMQVAYARSELNGPEGAAWAMSHSNPDDYRANALASLQYHRPAGWSARDPEATPSLRDRLALTGRIAAAGGWGGAAGTPPGGPGAPSGGVGPGAGPTPAGPNPAAGGPPGASPGASPGSPLGAANPEKPYHVGNVAFHTADWAGQFKHALQALLLAPGASTTVPVKNDNGVTVNQEVRSPADLERVALQEDLKAYQSTTPYKAREAATLKETEGVVAGNQEMVKGYQTSARAARNNSNVISLMDQGLEAARKSGQLGVGTGNQVLGPFQAVLERLGLPHLEQGAVTMIKELTNRAGVEAATEEATARGPGQRVMLAFLGAVPNASMTESGFVASSAAIKAINTYHDVAGRIAEQLTREPGSMSRRDLQSAIHDATQPYFDKAVQAAQAAIDAGVKPAEGKSGEGGAPKLGVEDAKAAAKKLMAEKELSPKEAMAQVMKSGGAAAGAAPTAPASEVPPRPQKPGFHQWLWDWSYPDRKQRQQADLEAIRKLGLSTHGRD